MKSAIKNLRTTAFVCATLVSSALFSASASAADTPATIPSSFLGTYNLIYANAQPDSPLTNGTAVQVIVGAGGTLCVAGYTLSNPVITNGNAHEATWTENTVGIKLSLSSLISGFNEINLATTSEVRLGQLKGSKTSTSTTGCGAVVTPQPDLTKINDFFALAQKHFAQFFPTASASANLETDGFIYRFYSGNDIYLAINDGQVYVMGGTFGNTPSTGVIAVAVARNGSGGYS